MDRKRDLYEESIFKIFGLNKNDITDDIMEQVKNSLGDFENQSYSIDDPAVNSWDEYYYNVCKQVARNSKCFSRKIGAVLVSDKTIVGTGYNGPPRGIPRCDKRWICDKNFKDKYAPDVDDESVKMLVGKCPRRVIGFKSGQGLDICIAGHAERNALINSASEGIKTKGTIMYMTCSVPCAECLIEIINAGVSEIVVTSLKLYDERSEYLINHCSLKIRVFDFIIN